MLRYKNKSQKILLLILILFCGINTNFFKNFAEVILYKFDDRIVKKYGFCSNESIGYLLYLKKKYEIKDNPKILNYIHTPNVNWAIINTKIINKNSKKFILLNYPGSEFKINLKRISNNLFEPNGIEFYHDKINKIKSLEITNKSQISQNISWKLDVVTREGIRTAIGKSQKEKTIKEFKIENLLKENLIIKLDILNKNLNLRENKIYFKIKNKNTNSTEDLQIRLIMTNKYRLEDFQIIDKIDNCYYIK